MTRYQGLNWDKTLRRNGFQSDMRLPGAAQCRVVKPLGCRGWLGGVRVLVRGFGLDYVILPIMCVPSGGEQQRLPLS